MRNWWCTWRRAIWILGTTMSWFWMFLVFECLVFRSLLYLLFFKVKMLFPSFYLWRPMELYSLGMDWAITFSLYKVCFSTRKPNQLRLFFHGNFKLLKIKYWLWKHLNKFFLEFWVFGKVFWSYLNKIYLCNPFNLLSPRLCIYIDIF